MDSLSLYKPLEYSPPPPGEPESGGGGEQQG
jgi:hypothetical protein